MAKAPAADFYPGAPSSVGSVEGTGKTRWTATTLPHHRSYPCPVRGRVLTICAMR